MRLTSRTKAVASASASRIVQHFSGNQEVPIYESINSMKKGRRSIPLTSSVGYVPTMGALHEGHLSLAKQARKENDVVIASVFVNPMQFGENEDLDKYPRQLERDYDLLSEYGVDYVFTPQCDEMYCKNHTAYVDLKGFNDTKEGKTRPGHFRGVATIVTKLFNIIQPDRAYFGQKDAAQCALMRRLVRDLNIPVDIVVCDTVRESDGLAMSSRNAYLSRSERDASPIIYQSLLTAYKLYKDFFLQTKNEQTASIPSSSLINSVVNTLKSEPMVSQIQYVSIDDAETMLPLSNVDQCGAILSLACIIGRVRLIDNIVLSNQEYI